MHTSKLILLAALSGCASYPQVPADSNLIFHRNFSFAGEKCTTAIIINGYSTTVLTPNQTVNLKFPAGRFNVRAQSEAGHCPNYFETKIVELSAASTLHVRVEPE